MTLKRHLWITLTFSTLYVLAGFLGRLTVVHGSGLALVWPAAGVVAVWFATVGWVRLVLLDVAVLGAAAIGVNFVTGAPLWLSLFLGWGAALQVGVFGLLVSRWAPHLWGRPDLAAPGLRGLGDMGHLIAAALAGAVASAVAGPALVLSVQNVDAAIFGAWIVRNSVSVAALFPLGLLLVAAVLAVRDRSGPRARSIEITNSRRPGSAGELAMLLTITTFTAYLVLVMNKDLPLPFLLIGTSVWAGARFTPLVATLHTMLVAVAVVAMTLADFGPFSNIGTASSQGLVVQAFVALSVVTSLALSVGREESARLTGLLTAAQSAAAGQAEMLSTILDSLADGVTVVGAGGRVILRNPAGVELLGSVPAESVEMIHPENYGLFRPDGTPVDPSQLPYVRALEGEPVQGMDIFLRTPAMPNGRLLEVSATPLTHSAEPMAVMVFHDVTADRRERDELASFAGVVAHDLLNPLTTVEGWSEALGEELREPEGGDAELELHHLARIQRASRRMRDLINDLLAYTTARDRKISPVPVDLDQLVRDVVRSRTESAAGQEHELAPVITVAELPQVLAEPVLLRQVVDNLIGNSVKYVAPGVVPMIDILGHQCEDGFVTVEVYDNGIGIPPGQHASIFDTFHRAHTDGYRGTGLGLSIVKRIVERHGGTVTASDNPRHRGTLLRFSFPAVPVEG